MPRGDSEIQQQTYKVGFRFALPDLRTATTNSISIDYIASSDNLTVRPPSSAD